MTRSSPVPTAIPMFEVTGRSESRASPDDWARLTRVRIAAADQVVVVCGEHTDSSVSMSAELRMAREAEKPVTLLWCRRESMCKKPLGALPNESMFSWTPDILRAQLAANRRLAQRRDVPARLKRKPLPGAATPE